MLQSWTIVGLLWIASSARINVNRHDSCHGLSPASEYVCKNPHHCGSVLARSTCSTTDYKGLVLFYHGYSACPQQAVDITPRLQEACLDVFVPVIPGHGEKFKNCTAGEFCDIAFGGGLGFDQRTLPVHSSKYQEFVADVNVVVEKELAVRAAEAGKEVKDLELSILGLSLGGALATYAVSLSPQLFTRQLLLNPYFGIGQEGVDQAAWGCLRDVENGEKQETECEDLVVQKWFESNDLSISENKPLRWLLSQSGGSGGAIAGTEKLLFQYLTMLSDYPPAGAATSIKQAVDKFMEKQVTWGENCPKIVEHGRGGFCTFRNKHLFATNAFGMKSLATGIEKARHGRLPITQIITTERDGFTRNGLAYALASNLYQTSQQTPWFSMTKAPPAGVGYCMYQYRNGTDLSDYGQYWSLDNVIPHANLVEADNPGDESVRWWEKKLFSNLVAFLSGHTDDVGEPREGSDRNTCVNIPLENDAITKHPWLRKIVLPECATTKEGDLKPSHFWQHFVLRFDWWAKHVGCPNFQSSLEGVVDCAQFAEQEKLARSRCCCTSQDPKSCQLFGVEDLNHSWSLFDSGSCPGDDGWNDVSGYDEIQLLPPACLLPHLDPNKPDHEASIDA